MVLEQLQRFLTQVELDAIMAHKGRDVIGTSFWSLTPGKDPIERAADQK
jgi:hypothetical protein